MVLFVTKKKERVPQALFEKYHGTYFLFYILGGDGWVGGQNRNFRNVIIGSFKKVPS